MATMVLPLRRMTTTIIVVILAGTIEAAPTKPGMRIRRKQLSTYTADATTTSVSIGCGSSIRAADMTTPYATQDTMSETSASSQLFRSESVENISYDADTQGFRRPLPSDSTRIKADVNKDTVDHGLTQPVTLKPTELLRTSGDKGCPERAAESSTIPTDTSTFIIEPSTPKQAIAEKEQKRSRKTLRPKPK